jgi:hypothetical protein
VASITLLGGVAAADLESRPFNFNPTTGLLNIPIAAVAAPGELVLGGARASFGDANDDQAWLRVGLSPTTELALNHIASDATTLNAQFLAGKTADYSVAVGVQNLLGRRPGAQDAQGQGKILDPAVYAVVTRPLTPSVRAHYGLGSGRFGNFFGGLDYAPAPSLLLMAEWDGQEMNAGARWTFLRTRHADGSGFSARLTGAYLDMTEPSLGIEFSLTR